MLIKPETIQADLLDYDSQHAKILGCTEGFHVAGPVTSTIVPNPEARSSLLHPKCLDSLTNENIGMEPNYYIH